MELRFEVCDANQLPRLGDLFPLGRPVILEPASPTEFLRRPPLMTFDPHETGFSKLVNEPRMVQRRAVICQAVNEARQTGHRLIADRHGVIAFDEIVSSAEAGLSILERWANLPVWSEQTGIRSFEGAFVCDRLDNPGEVIPGETLSLLSVEPANYGSWLFRVIPKLAVMADLGLDGIKVACWCPARLADLLSCFGISNDKIVRVEPSRTYIFERLVVPTVLNPEAYLNETTLRLYSKCLTSLGIHRTPRRKIYLSRISNAARRGYKNTRYFIDEPKLIDALSKQGFEIIEPETLSLRDQIKTFAEASMVVGASGAGMFNTVFCRPGTLIVDIEAFPNWLHAHSNYFSSCGHNYVMAFGAVDKTDDSGPHKRWTIDIDALTRLVKELTPFAPRAN